VTHRYTTHHERHLVERIGWLRAAVLGANDGIISTASLIVGVAAATQDRAAVLTAGVAALVAGAMSMAAGEYVSVSSQADAEAADRAGERAELDTMPEAELEELTGIYQARGLDRALAEQVAAALTAKDAYGAHLRDELGLTDAAAARPVQAALISAGMFATGAVLPLIAAAAGPSSALAAAVSATALVCLAGLGCLGAVAGGASPWKPAWRVTLWGALAMAATWAIGTLFGAVVG
jgi:VIT1/CCC1 family predicted Fe2+/Mn2+ transporter